MIMLPFNLKWYLNYLFLGGQKMKNHTHIKEFENIVSIFQEANTPLEIFRMKLFPSSLKDKTKT